MTMPSCRLFVIPARDAHKAVILRRGPSKWYHIILWDTKRDQFEEGAWFKGRIYEEKCDLSPDGQVFVYFVHQGNRARTTYSHAWTAVSRPPWLHALTLWPDTDTYGGGGRFTGDRRLQIRGAADETHPDHPVFRQLQVFSGSPELHSSTDEISGTDWSGRDHAGRVIFTRGGKVFRQEQSGENEIADFTDRVPDPQPPPVWAKQPV